MQKYSYYAKYFILGIVEIQQHIPGKEIVSYCIKNNAKIPCPNRTVDKSQRRIQKRGYRSKDVWSGRSSRSSKYLYGHRNIEKELEKAFYAL